MNAITLMHRESHIPAHILCEALGMPRSTYYRHQQNRIIVPADIKHPANALSEDERQRVIDLLHDERFVDKTPYEAFNASIDAGEYYCSVRTMYRVLQSQGESQDRRVQRNHRDAIKPELIATKPNEVWSWDITKLRSDRKWVYFYLYVILDVYSRYVVGWLIADRESKELARKLIQKTALRQGIQPHQLTLHSDNGPSMTSHTVAQLLDTLGIIKTHNRPHTSNDNPFSESQFKTLKYCPEFPGRFTDEPVAEKFCQKFFGWYNTEHYHSGIAWLTPQCVHYGHAQDVLQKRYQTLLEAYLNNPTRFNNRPPKLKQLPTEVYINPPQTVKIDSKNVENNLDNLENNVGQKMNRLVV